MSVQTSNTNSTPSGKGKIVRNGLIALIFAGAIFYGLFFLPKGKPAPQTTTTTLPKVDTPAVAVTHTDSVAPTPVSAKSVTTVTTTTKATVVATTKPATHKKAAVTPVNAEQPETKPADQKSNTEIPNF
jgi:hypothetical protein